MKKLSPSFIGFLIALLVTILSLVVYFEVILKKSYYLIDNPTKATLNVTIDQNKYVVSPGQELKINLEKGQHTLEVASEVDSLNFPASTFEVKRVRGLINPTRSVYFIYGLPYGPMVDKDSIFGKLKTTYQGKTYLGDVKIDSTIYNEDFYYNLDEDFPAFTRKSENDTLRKKIFRVGDFKQFYFENYE